MVSKFVWRLLWKEIISESMSIKLSHPFTGEYDFRLIIHRIV
jgi:hypothetical protein